MIAIHGFCQNKRLYEPTTIIAISSVIGAGIAGYSAYETAHTKMPDMPGAPDPTKAESDAKESERKRRLMLAGTGAKTDLTQGKGIVLGDNISTINLSGM